MLNLNAIDALKIAAEQSQLADTVEDRLDYIIEDILAKTRDVSSDELESVQAAALPTEINRDQPNR